MKKILTFIFILTVFTNCKAQQVVDMSQDAGTDTPTGTYYKDTQNLLDPFSGTYIYAEGTTTLKIVLQKKTMASVANGRYYEDLIIGEYQYIKNGVELENTLSKLTENIDNAWKYTIDGNNILNGQILGCDDCTPTEKRLRLGIVDNVKHYGGQIDVRRIIVNGQPAIKIHVTWRAKTLLEGEPEPPRPGLADGEYILLLQP